MPPLVSVILPTYNRAHTLERAIRSVLQQTARDFELIIVDDGSTDQTSTILSEYGSLEDVQVISQVHRGCSSARNAGLSVASGRYIAFQDSDDEWLPDKLEKAVFALDHAGPGVGVFYSDMLRIRRNGQIVHHYSPDVLTGSLVSEDTLDYQVLGIGIQSAVIKRECFDAVGRFDEALPRLIDLDLFIRLSEHFAFLHHRTALVKYYDEEEGISTNARWLVIARAHLIKKYRRRLKPQKEHLAAQYYRLARACYFDRQKRKFKWFLVKALLASTPRSRTRQEVLAEFRRAFRRRVPALPITPVTIRLEASSFCQLRCPSCPTTSRAIHPAVGSGFLKLSDFRQLLDENPQVQEIELANYGEIFLNPDLLEIIKYAHRRKVTLRADTGVNLNRAKDDVLDAMVRYGFRSMTCSVDGTSNETYKVYRVNGDLHNVLENLRKINQLKINYRSDYPELTWQFIAFGHNEHEIGRARQLASDLRMKFYVKLSWDVRFSPVQDQALVRKEAGAASREEYRRLHGVDYVQSICHQLWDQPQINWDGKVLGCCRNFWGDFGGNAFTDGLVKSVNNEKIQYARGMLLGKKAARDDIPCTTCDIYLGMKADGSWLQRGDSSLGRAPARRETA